MRKCGITQVDQVQQEGKSEEEIETLKFTESVTMVTDSVFPGTENPEFHSSQFKHLT